MTDVTPSTILAVDDDLDTLLILEYRLKQNGHQVVTTYDGRYALELMHQQSFDLVLIDMMMPVMNGIDLLTAIKSDPDLRHTPVLMMSAVNHRENVVSCIQMGAEDFLDKPIDTILLDARLNGLLARKRWRLQQQALLAEISSEREKSDKLLRNILPETIAKRLKSGESHIVDTFDSATVLFADIVDFTQLFSRHNANRVVESLNEVFIRFDQLVGAYGLEKIKTIGDEYMVVGGVPKLLKNHTLIIADLALAMQSAISHIMRPTGEKFEIRIGIDTGPIVAGIIGHNKFLYDLWGDAVNVASRMQELAHPCSIQVTEAVAAALSGTHICEYRDDIYVKGKGIMPTYFLLGRVSNSVPNLFAEQMPVSVR